MAMPKTADAHLIHPSVTKTEWSNIRVSGKGIRIASEGLQDNLIERASSFFSKPFNPKDYLLSHATIIASVDSKSPPDIKTGSMVVDGFKIDRRYPDYCITPETQKYINNNKDAWNRYVLSMAYPTFVGAHNFVEHVQVEALSKGRIIDAVARDIGDSIYVDILIATDRMHKDLIKAIQNRKMGTLSMGCTVDGTICTKCGHWAADETEMCTHIKYMKGNKFFDEQGVQHVIAELCGHQDISPTGGVVFVEGSWVKAPAFTGAVLRNVLESTPEINTRAAQVLATPPPQWSPEAQLKAARFGSSNVVASDFETPTHQSFTVDDYSEDDNGFFAGWMDEEESNEDEGKEKKKRPLEDVEDELEQFVLDRVKTRIKDKLHQKTLDREVGEDDSSMAPNDNLIKEGTTKTAYIAGLDMLVKVSNSDVELMDAVASFNARVGVHIPVPIYRAALQMGCHTNFSNVEEFKSACESVLEHKPTLLETKTILRLSKLLSQRRALREPREAQGGDQ